MGTSFAKSVTARLRLRHWAEGQGGELVACRRKFWASRKHVHEATVRFADEVVVFRMIVRPIRGVSGAVPVAKDTA